MVKITYVHTCVIYNLGTAGTSRTLGTVLGPSSFLCPLTNHTAPTDYEYRLLINQNVYTVQYCSVRKTKTTIAVIQDVPQIISSSFFFLAQISCEFSANRSAIFCISLVNVRFVMSMGFGW